MAGIGKKKEDKREDSIDNLIKEFNESTDKIRELLTGNKDKNKMPDDLKKTLRIE